MCKLQYVIKHILHNFYVWKCQNKLTILFIFRNNTKAVVFLFLFMGEFSQGTLAQLQTGWFRVQFWCLAKRAVPTCALLQSGQILSKSN